MHAGGPAGSRRRAAVDEARLWGLLAGAVAATYVWRGLGVVISGRIDPTGAVFQWFSCVAYAMLAGLIARMVILPVGVLGESALAERLAAAGRRPAAALATCGPSGAGGCTIWCPDRAPSKRRRAR